tara:strand:+ start:632 stop:1438 length:807 start_codon:yes stop_codon:yes gene_type:complete
MTLQLYCPPNKQSKAYLVLDAARKGWPETIDIKNYARGDGPAMFWGFVGENFNLMKDLQRRNKTFYFADMPYFGRWNGDNNAEHYWRITKNELHPSVLYHRMPDRFERFGKTIEQWKNTGEHILVCPSSPTMNRWYDHTDWVQDTVAKLQQHTDRKIVVREKPRAKGTSGPRAVELGGLKTFEEEAKGAWAVVTSVSMCAIDAVCMGIPIFTSNDSAVRKLGLQDLSKIEEPVRPQREPILYSLAYNQFTPQEIASGYARNILENDNI